MTDNSNKEMNEVEPVLLEKIMGQPQVVNLLSTHVNAYWNDRQAGKSPSFGPVGLFGPPGVGKTMIAHSLHGALANLKFVEVIGESLEHKDSLYGTLMSVDENTTLFIDEAQGLPKAAQHVLLKVLAENKLCVPKGRYAKRDYQIPLPKFVTIIASTHEFVLQAALRSRIRIYTRMGYYGMEDLTKIVQQRADGMGLKCETCEIFSLIAARSKRTPRLALRHLDTCYHVARSQDSEVITLDHVKQAFQLSEIDDLGLDHLEQSFLRQLAESGALRLNVLSSRLGLPPRTIQDVVEPYMIQEGLITKEGSERIITDKGLRHITGSA